MAKNIYDLHPNDTVKVRHDGVVKEANFIGFIDVGVTCQVGLWKSIIRPDGSKGSVPSNPIIPVADLVLEA